VLSFSPAPPTRLQRAYRATWGRVFAAGYDRMLAAAEAHKLGRLRARVVGGVSGTVVDLGAGTGANLAHLPPDVTYIAVEPDRAMARQLEGKAVAAGVAVDLRIAPAEVLPLADASADHVLATLVLCTVADPAAVLAEARRVLRPGGTLHLLEHVRSGDARTARIQDLLRGPWAALACGCQANRRTATLLEPAGFCDVDLEHLDLPGCGPMVKSMIVGTARRPA
jgi:ubiquinone/menaquinone biosynthesis C-methylase UbiE